MQTPTTVGVPGEYQNSGLIPASITLPNAIPATGSRGFSNVRLFKAEISESTVDQNRQHAFQLNLTCLIGWQRCDKFSELMPAAWADFQDDNQWFDTQQSTGLLPPQTDCQ